ncbi:DUF456 domain-containing protein [Alkalicoccus chagannorensis]|uniref:DUF456 domain-containing protein n=1 Tax=Alkalicoccus chagannorensis TaxID=427072 RepID=UPI000418BB71|nr:DUF456 family protein [Alkalicoccus chagannorensis]
MLDILVWAIISVLFVLSFIGLLYPIIPSVLVIWGGVILYALLIDGGAVSWWTWLSFAVLTIVLFVADYIAGMFFVKKYGSTKHGMTAATVGLIFGAFIIPPFGILVLPFLLVFLTELVQQRTPREAAKTAFGSILGFLAGTFAKALIQALLIGIFLVDVFFFT